MMIFNKNKPINNLPFSKKLALVNERSVNRTITIIKGSKIGKLKTDVNTKFPFTRALIAEVNVNVKPKPLAPNIKLMNMVDCCIIWLPKKMEKIIYAMMAKAIL